MTIYALDTNVVIDFLRGNESIQKKVIVFLSEGFQLSIPSIVYYEIMRGFTESKETRRLKEFQQLYKSLKMLYLDRDNTEVLNTAITIYGSLRKSGNLIEDNDIFIAAIAIANDAILVTDNIKHFSRIDGLKLDNWKE